MKSYYEKVFWLVCLPNIILFLAAIIFKSETIGTLWAVSCMIYFICFAAQPDKVFFIENGKIKFKP